MFAGFFASCHAESKPGWVITLKGTYVLVLFSRHWAHRLPILLTTFSCEFKAFGVSFFPLVGFGKTTAIPLLQINLFLDLMQLYLNPETTTASPSFLQAPPVLTTEIPAGALKIENAIERLITKATPFCRLN